MKGMKIMVRCLRNFPVVMCAPVGFTTFEMSLVFFGDPGGIVRNPGVERIDGLLLLMFRVELRGFSGSTLKACGTWDSMWMVWLRMLRLKGSRFLSVRRLQYRLLESLILNMIVRSVTTVTAALSVTKITRGK